MAQLVLDNGEVLTIASNNVVGGRGEVVTQSPVPILVNTATQNGAGSTATTFSSFAISASGLNRVLVIAILAKDNTATAAVISAITVDAAGANATLGNGKVVQQGSRQLAQEGNFSSQCDVYFVLEANLPSAAGSYDIVVTMDSAAQYLMCSCQEITGVPDQAYDVISQGSSTADVSSDVAFSSSITPSVDDCLILDLWGTSHSAAPTFTSTEEQTFAISNTNGGAVGSEFNQGPASAKSMEQSSSTFHQRRAFTLLSFSGVSGDVTAPVLSSPTGTKTGSTTADGTVSTDEGNGTLYFTATENTSETAGTIKAASSQAVSGSGTQNVSFSGLTPSTTYYAHYVQDDAATNTSNVQSSSSFTTDAAGGLGVPIAAYHYNHNVGSNL